MKARHVLTSLALIALLLSPAAFADTAQCDPATTCAQMQLDMLTQIRDTAVKSMQVVIAAAASVGFLIGMVVGRLR
ncbi:hypothetical protein AB0305_03730 [Arthrobacter sp. NPDC080086]|uniref:hypothetical protein n=1 Tax=Arthrobacter sp. NPDC080086 TaxID=3155917 RepID=UPI003450BEDA